MVSILARQSRLHFPIPEDRKARLHSWVPARSKDGVTWPDISTQSAAYAGKLMCFRILISHLLRCRLGAGNLHCQRPHILHPCILQLLPFSPVAGTAPALPLGPCCVMYTATTWAWSVISPAEGLLGRSDRVPLKCYACRSSKWCFQCTMGRSTKLSRCPGMQ